MKTCTSAAEAQYVRDCEMPYTGADAGFMGSLALCLIVVGTVLYKLTKPHDA